MIRDLHNRRDYNDDADPPADLLVSPNVGKICKAATIDSLKSYYRLEHLLEVRRGPVRGP